MGFAKLHQKRQLQKLGSRKCAKTAHNLLIFSDVLRTYDITAQLSVPTTLDRVVQILASFDSLPKGKGIINCEDEPYVAASLGCAIGVMRHPAFIQLRVTITIHLK